MKWCGEWNGKTLIDLLEVACERYSEREAIVFHDERVSYRRLKDRVDELAKGLLAIGLNKGDKVGIWLSNGINWIVAQCAIIRAGGVMVPLNSRLKAFDVDYILRHSDATTLIMMDRFLKNNYLDIFEEVIPEHKEMKPGDLRVQKFSALRNVICFGEKKLPCMFGPGEVVMRGANGGFSIALEERARQISATDVVNLPYTSGTTGFPKGVMTTHLQYIGEILIFRERLGLREGDRFLAPAPFFANFGNYFGILLPMLVGGCTVPLESFDPGECLRLIEKERCTHFTGTPTIFQDVLAHPDFNKYDLRSLRTAMTGASAASEQMINDVRSKMGIQSICNGYGMTENSGATTMTCATDRVDVIVKTTGKPFTDVAIRIADRQSGATLGPNEIGELCTKGWIVMKGYYKNEKETEKCFDSDGWFHTSDLGYMDDEGNFIITGRMKDMFISGGQNAYPTEIENFLYSFSKIKEVAVIGVPDDRMGEVGFAFVVLKDGERSSEEEIRKHCQARIANYKVPKYVKIVTELPMAGVGKIQKFKLLQDAEEEINSRKTKAS